MGTPKPIELSTLIGNLALDSMNTQLLFNEAHEADIKRFRCAQVTQRGDSEAVIFISHYDAMSRALDLRVAINTRKRPTLTGEQRQQKALRVLQVRPNPDHLVGLFAQERLVLAGYALAFDITVMQKGAASVPMSANGHRYAASASTGGRTSFSPAPPRVG